MHTPPHNPHWFPCHVACSPSRICVWPGLMLFIASTFLCGGIAEVNPPLPEKQNKTMESVRHSKANGFTAASSPPSLFMCKSIHRVLMAPVMHDTDSFKWPRKKMRTFHTPAELAENNSGGVYWISIFISRWCKRLFTVLMALVWFRLIFTGDDCV